MPKRGRTTVDVDYVADLCHRVIASPAGCANPAVRETACHVLEMVLQETGRYKGFRFNVPTDPETKTLPPSHPEYYNRHYFTHN